MNGNSFQRHLQAKFANCISTSCKRRSCELRLSSLSRDSFVVIDTEKYKTLSKFKGELCDYILFYIQGSSTVAVIELKSGRVKATKAVKQIQKGSKLAEQIIEEHPVYNFLPILLHGRRMHHLELKTLRGSRIRFKDKDYVIIMEPCGSELKDILIKYPPQC